MFAIGAATQIFLATGATDLRKGCNGLFALVRARWDRDALSGDLYLFCNRRREALKILDQYPPAQKSAKIIRPAGIGPTVVWTLKN